MTNVDQLVIFDLDGTLVDSVEQISRILNLARMDFGVPPQPQWFYEELIGLPVKELLSDLTIDSITRDNLIAHFRALLILDIQKGNVEIYPGVIELLQLLEHMQIGVAIATSKPTKIAKEVVRCSTLSKFSIYVQGTDDFPPKPDPTVILRVITQFEGRASLMVGDRTEDVIAAKRASIGAIGIAASAHSEAQLTDVGAAQTFKSILHFYEAIKDDASLEQKLSFLSRLSSTK